MRRHGLGSLLNAPRTAIRSSGPLVLLLLVHCTGMTQGCRESPADGKEADVPVNQFFWIKHPTAPRVAHPNRLASLAVGVTPDEGYKVRFGAEYHWNAEFSAGFVTETLLGKSQRVGGILLLWDETDEPELAGHDRSQGRVVRMSTPCGGTRIVLWDGESKPSIQVGDLTVRDEDGAVTICKLEWDGVREGRGGPFGSLRAVFRGTVLPLTEGDARAVSFLSENSSRLYGKRLEETESFVLVDLESQRDP